MSIWGIILGGAAGLALGGPLGALIGAAAGHATARGIASVVPSPEIRRQARFTVAVVALAAKLARSDGAVDAREWQRFRQIFRVDSADAADVERFFRIAQQSTAGFESYADQIGDLFRDDQPRLEAVLEALVLIALADGSVRAQELAFFDRVAEIFRMPAAPLARLRVQLTGDPLDDPHAVLGIPTEAGLDEIRAAYRRLARDNHPDLQQARGVPAEFMAVVEARMRLINAAYDKLLAKVPA